MYSGCRRGTRGLLVHLFPQLLASWRVPDDVSNEPVVCWVPRSIQCPPSCPPSCPPNAPPNWVQRHENRSGSCRHPRPVNSLYSGCRRGTRGLVVHLFPQQLASWRVPDDFSNEPMVCWVPRSIQRPPSCPPNAPPNWVQRHENRSGGVAATHCG